MLTNTGAELGFAIIAYLILINLDFMVISGYALIPTEKQVIQTEMVIIIYLIMYLYLLKAQLG